MSLTYTKATQIVLKGHPEFDEKWVQQRIADDPSILGLGDLELKDVERMQPKAGRLDLLLRDSETDKRYEVELMLGALDESHIIRAIEYWDIERKRYPLYKHCAVIVAEDITSRFLNVIGLFNSVIPIIAIQMAALHLDNKILLTFTKVLDEVEPGEDDENDGGGQVTNREYWENKASKEGLTLTDRCLEILRQANPKLSLNYRKNYVGLAQENRANNFVLFFPKKKHLMVFVRIDDHEGWRSRLDEAGVTVMNRASRTRLMIKLDPEDVEKHKAFLKEFLATAYQEQQE